MSISLPKNEIFLSSEFSKGLIKLIDQAERSIFIFMFDWRWYKNDISCDVSLINQALVRAVRRGVSVQTLLNYDDLVEQLSALKIQARKANVKKLLHAKSIVIDEKIVVIGSHNLSKEAMTANVEMSVAIDDADLAKRIIDYFKSLWNN
jgi:phosphatidylserine/phosphatidylglycerophosphate/cardiolipin synthase-like enzyme